MIDTLIFWWIWLTGLSLYLSVAGGAIYVLIDSGRRQRVFNLIQLAQNIARSYKIREGQEDLPSFNQPSPQTVRMTPPPSAEEKKIN